MSRVSRFDFSTEVLANPKVLTARRNGRLVVVCCSEEDEIIDRMEPSYDGSPGCGGIVSARFKKALDRIAYPRASYGAGEAKSSRERKQRERKLKSLMSGRPGPLTSVWRPKFLLDDDVQAALVRLRENHEIGVLRGLTLAFLERNRNFDNPLEHDRVVAEWELLGPTARSITCKDVTVCGTKMEEALSLAHLDARLRHHAWRLGDRKLRIEIAERISLAIGGLELDPRDARATTVIHSLVDSGLYTRFRQRNIDPQGVLSQIEGERLRAWSAPEAREAGEEALRVAVLVHRTAAMAKKALGDDAGARGSLLQAVEYAELARWTPMAANLHADLAMMYWTMQPQRVKLHLDRALELTLQSRWERRAVIVSLVNAMVLRRSGRFAEAKSVLMDTGRRHSELLRRRRFDGGLSDRFTKELLAVNREQKSEEKGISPVYDWWLFTDRALYS